MRDALQQLHEKYWQAETARLAKEAAYGGDRDHFHRCFEAYAKAEDELRKATEVFLRESAAEVSHG
jgi:hypothetical protein